MNSQSLFEPLEALGPLPGADASGARSAHVALRVQARETLLSYLPLMLLGLMALGTWWLVQNARLPQAELATAPPRHEPDYSMQTFSVQRFTSEGRLRAQIDGDSLRHYPDTDTLEIDNPHIKAYAPDGRVTLASAGRALVNGDATEVQLIGDARVTRAATGTGAGLQFRGEFLHAFFQAEQVRSHLPVTITRGSTTLRANALSYDNLYRAIVLSGNVQATFEAVASRPAHE